MECNLLLVVFPNCQTFLMVIEMIAWNTTQTFPLTLLSDLFDLSPSLLSTFLILLRFFLSLSFHFLFPVNFTATQLFLSFRAIGHNHSSRYFNHQQRIASHPRIILIVSLFGSVPSIERRKSYSVSPSVI